LVCRYAVAARVDSRELSGTTRRPVSYGMCPIILYLPPGCSCRRSQSLGALPAICRSPNVSADVARLSPCSICLLSLPSQYAFGVGGRLPWWFANRGLPIPVSCPKVHRPAPSSALPVSLLTKLSCDGRPGGSLPAFASGNVATRILAITARHLLSPPSSTRTVIGMSYDITTLAGTIRAYHVPHVWRRWFRPLLMHRRSLCPWRMRMEHPCRPQLGTCQHLWFLHSWRCFWKVSIRWPCHPP